jgi:hypothetical protein
MTGRQFRKWGLVVTAVALLALIGYVAYFVIGFVYYQGGSGSMAEAQRLRPVVEAMPPPSASAVYYRAGAVGVVFPSGEWVVGVVKDSHGMYSRLKGGGTVVLKDSRGRVRCFFGHVCGSGNIGQEAPGVFDSLDAHDAYLAKQFVEQSWQ